LYMQNEQNGLFHLSSEIFTKHIKGVLK